MGLPPIGEPPEENVYDYVHCTPFNIVLYSHANVVTSASEQNFNSGDMALYK